MESSSSRKLKAESANSSGFWVPKCRCNHRAVIYTSRTLENPDKRFWRCPHWNEPKGCQFFRWVREGEEENSGEETTEVDDGNHMRSCSSWCLELKDYELKETHKKLLKIQKKLEAEKKFGKLMLLCLVLSWLLVAVLLTVVMGN
ncbi:hypothetical protein OROGR_017041 [Orobanche gracilis]